jgi:glycosyltransferase involved in cell wall biosynthesis
MRVMVVHGRYRSAAPSGENNVVDQESAALTEAGHQVELFQRSSDDISGWSLPKRAALPALSISNPEVRRALTQRLVDWRPDVVHVHNTFPLLSPSVLRACWSARVPVVTTLHNYKLLCASGDFYRDGAPCHDCATGDVLPAMARGCYRGSRAASVAVASGTLANRRAWRSMVSAYLFISASQRDLMAGLALPAERVFVKHNFVDPPPDRGSLPPQHRVACVGRLDAAKGAPFLMRAWDRFRVLHPTSGLRLAVAGGGPLADEVRRWGDRHDSVDVYGHLSRAEVADLMAGSRAVLVPSQWEETFGLVAVEAMAEGVAPIAPCRGSFPELFDDGVDGALFLPDDVEDLARVLAQVDTDPADFAERGRRARATHAARFARSTSVAVLEEAYRFAVANPAYRATAASLGREQEAPS